MGEAFAPRPRALKRDHWQRVRGDGKERLWLPAWVFEMVGQERTYPICTLVQANAENK